MFDALRTAGSGLQTAAANAHAAAARLAQAGTVSRDPSRQVSAAAPDVVSPMVDLITSPQLARLNATAARTAGATDTGPDAAAPAGPDRRPSEEPTGARAGPCWPGGRTPRPGPAGYPTNLRSAGPITGRERTPPRPQGAPSGVRSRPRRWPGRQRPRGCPGSDSGRQGTTPAAAAATTRRRSRPDPHRFLPPLPPLQCSFSLPIQSPHHIPSFSFGFSWSSSSHRHPTAVPRSSSEAWARDTKPPADRHVQA